MCTSVPQMPARRTRIRTSSSRIVGSATSFSLNPGAADSFTRAFTRAALRLTIDERRRDAKDARRESKPRTREIAREGSSPVVWERKLQREQRDTLLHQLTGNSIFAFTTRWKFEGTA